jgi:hypothetical protein
MYNYDRRQAATISKSRARRIVELAAKEVSLRSIKQRIKEDTSGKFEQQARDLVEKTKAKAEKEGLSEAEVDEQVAIYLAYITVESEKRR